MKTSMIDEDEKVDAHREAARAFGRQQDYDVTYMEALLEASPGAYAAFAAAMGMSRYQNKAPSDLLAIAKITATRVEDCGPCVELGIKLAREAGVSDAVIHGALFGGQGLSGPYLKVYQYARAVAANETMEPGLIEGLEDCYGREVLAELAVAIAGVKIYPTVKRALGFARSCPLMPSLV
jgi:AhpD family alkylhydroperoxidase